MKKKKIENRSNNYKAFETRKKHSIETRVKSVKNTRQFIFRFKLENYLCTKCVISFTTYLKLDRLKLRYMHINSER